MYHFGAKKWIRHNCDCCNQVLRNVQVSHVMKTQAINIWAHIWLKLWFLIVIRG